MNNKGFVQQSWNSSLTIIRTFAKSATATAVRTIGIVAVSSQDADSGTSTKNSSRVWPLRCRLTLSRTPITALTTSPGLSPAAALARTALAPRINERSIVPIFDELPIHSRSESLLFYSFEIFYMTPPEKQWNYLHFFFLISFYYWHFN